MLSTSTFSQTGGDEDKEMFNHGRQRDQHAIDEAVNTWWTASMKTQAQRIQWWKEAKFGMFIHWGIYSLPAGGWKGKKVSGYAEHLMRKEKITRGEYLELAQRFNPTYFDVEQWILHAKDAGMKYFIITAKHHDGFAMYDSEVGDFDIITQSQFKRDPISELAIAARKHGIYFGFYYSHAFDWEHPDAPGNDWEYKNPGGDLNLFGGRNWYDHHPELLPKAQKYVDEKAIPQIKELIKKYHPDILWFDTPHKLPLSENIRILKAIRDTDPDIIVNGRLARNATINFGDYKNTADRPAEFFPVAKDKLGRAIYTDGWEAIPTTNESYGYHQYDNSHKPVSHFIQLLANAASRGGNLLMNIGPKGDGTFDTKDLSILKAIGGWLGKNGESIYGTTASILPLQSWGVSTFKKNKLYLHVFSLPADGQLFVGGLRSSIGKVYLLTDPKKQLTHTKLNAVDMSIKLPIKGLDTINTVVVVELKDSLIVNPLRFISPNSTITRLLAYDAVQDGEGFSFGDGKANRYYVEGWKSMDQSLYWHFRIVQRQDYELVIKYLASEDGDAVFRVQVDNELKFDYPVKPGKNNEVITENLKIVGLGEGQHRITIVPVKLGKQELMKILELQLHLLSKK